MAAEVVTLYEMFFNNKEHFRLILASKGIFEIQRESAMERNAWFRVGNIFKVTCRDSVREGQFVKFYEVTDKLSADHDVLVKIFCEEARKFLEEREGN